VKYSHYDGADVELDRFLLVNRFFVLRKGVPTVSVNTLCTAYIRSS